jgi:hypothetical protein
MVKNALQNITLRANNEKVTFNNNVNHIHIKQEHDGRIKESRLFKSG